MQKISDIFDPHDELNIYLVEHKLKSSSKIGLNSKSPKFSEFTEKKEQTNLLWIKRHNLTFNQEIIEQTNKLLDNLDLVYRGEIFQNKSVSYHNALIIPIIHQIHLFSCYNIYIGKDKQSLDLLLNAKTDKEIGHALDFPEDAVEAYNKNIDGEQRDGQYYLRQIIKAKNAGIELPTWLAYTSHVPKQFDIVNNNISKSSEELGRKYQNFVKQNNPELAKRVEQEFFKIYDQTFIFN